MEDSIRIARFHQRIKLQFPQVDRLVLDDKGSDEDGD